VVRQPKTPTLKYVLQVNELVVQLNFIVNSLLVFHIKVRNYYSLLSEYIVRDAVMIFIRII
jgi:hypothetical protein